MVYPVKNFCGGSEYSIALEDGFLVVQNGVQGEVRFLASSVAILQDCSGTGSLCGGTPLQKTKNEYLVLSGTVVDCSSSSTQTTSLDPEKFGFEDVSSLATYIQNLLNVTVEVLIQNAIEGQGEIFAQEQKTGFTFGGKPIWKTAQIHEGFISGNDITHDLDVEQFLNLQIFAYDADFPLIKKVVEQNQQLGGDCVFETAQSNIIDSVTLPAGYDTILLYAEYTKTDQ